MQENIAFAKLLCKNYCPVYLSHILLYSISLKYIFLVLSASASCLDIIEDNFLTFSLYEIALRRQILLLSVFAV